jgi:ornithine--oxo-acid transaminase
MRNMRVHETKFNRSGEGFDIGAMLAEHEPERYALHTRHMNEMMVRVLQTLGFDVGFRSGQGQYLFDRAGNRYLDLLSGWGVFGIGRNHPLLRKTLSQVLASDLPNLVQMDVSVLSGLLAERLLGFVPYLDKVFFTNSGSEAVEAAIKFARRATRRPGIVYCDHAFHGLTYGVPDFSAIPFNDLAALEKALSPRDVAACTLGKATPRGAGQWRRAKADQGVAAAGRSPGVAGDELKLQTRLRTRNESAGKRGRKEL